MIIKKYVTRTVALLGVICVIGNGANVQASKYEGIDLSCESSIVMNMDTKEVIWYQNAKEKRQIASTTKIMTGLLLAENAVAGDKLIFSKEAMSMPSSSVYRDTATSLKDGDSLLAEDVMNGLMMESGNDMAVVIAEHISGTEDKFSELMDERAKSIGMEDTDFFTASGLDTDSVLGGGEHYSTAYDMAILGVEAYKNPWLRKAVATKKTTFNTSGNGSYELVNSNKNLGVNGCVGGKTGYTTKAGRCLVAYYDVDGVMYVGVVLGGAQGIFFEDMGKIIGESINREKEKFIQNGDVVKNEQLEYKSLRWIGSRNVINVPLIVNGDLMMYNNEYNSQYMKAEIKLKNRDIWKIKKGEVIGSLVVSDGYASNELELIADVGFEDVLMKSRVLYITLLFMSILVGYLVFRTRKRRL